MSEPITEDHIAGFERPNILLSAREENGIITLTVREGAAMMLPAKTTREETDVETEDDAFRIRSTNRINFGGAIINVINDECTYGEVHLAATAPTASEYLARIGKETTVSFHQRLDVERRTKKMENGFIIGRTRIILP